MTLTEIYRDRERLLSKTMSDGSVRYVIKVRDTDGDWNINKHVKIYENIDGIERTVLAESIFDSIEEAKDVLIQQYGKHVVKEETVYRKE